MSKQAVKIDVGLEVDLGTALNIKPDDCPQILFIKNGKGLYKLEGIFFTQLFFAYILCSKPLIEYVGDVVLKVRSFCLRRFRQLV